MLPDHETPAFTHGVHNLLSNELIPQDAAQDSDNWYTQDGRIKLIPGRWRIGTEGAVGTIQGYIVGYKVDGTKVHWRKTSGGKIQYSTDLSTWNDVVTGLGSGEYTFANYSSLAGTFTYAFGADGIYKFHNANPGSYNSMYSSTKNFKGYAFIDRGRTILWNRSAPSKDTTGVYGSYIDRQDSTVYTTVSTENLASGNGVTKTFTGTLAFKGGGATRNCFAVAIACTDGGGETFTDNYDGTLTGSAGGTGTINYISGAFSVTFFAAPSNTANNVKATSYQWEDSNAKGVTDFTHSATRLAGEGFVIPQDEGGDAIKRIVIGQDGAYYSLKSQSAYRLDLDVTDLNPVNEVYSRNMGVPSMRSVVSTQKGIVFLNTANPERPELTVLQKDPIGGNIVPQVLFAQFRFANYTYDDCSIGTFERYIPIACKSANATANDKVLLCDLAQGTVDITTYNARTFATDNGYLYIGSSITQTVYRLYDGFDDDGYAISNYWIGKGDQLIPNLRPSVKRPIPRGLKKVRKLRLKGRIDFNQYYEVYISYDDAGFQLAGTIRGSGSYVDDTQPQEIGASIIGGPQIGADVVSTVFPYYAELKLKAPKFRKRTLKFVAKGIGYVDIENTQDHMITVFEDRLPTRFRQKQNVSLDGLSTDRATPQY